MCPRLSILPKALIKVLIFITPANPLRHGLFRHFGDLLKFKILIIRKEDAASKHSTGAVGKKAKPSAFEPLFGAMRATDIVL